MSPYIDDTEYLSIDEIIDRAILLSAELPSGPDLREHAEHIADLRERLAGGRLRIAVLGQFNRGKSTFINALLGLPVLPTSVLPITSVPTVIAWGERNGSTVEFLDGSLDVSEGDTPAAIAAHLSTFVTEKNNPLNERGVANVTVKCRSELLRHGTVIIDTPGFGSTHTHNTQTTIDLLASCDAALFLLSADLPITQVEIDFLHRVVLTVPRLFFIYNKTDLLEGEELDTTRTFIIDTLNANFSFGPELTLYPVSAKSFTTAPDIKEDKKKAWTTSGLETIETDIITFLLREKYFALSEALSGKFKAALEGIHNSLATRRADLLAPLNAARELAARTVSVEQSIATKLSEEMDKAAGERSTILTRGRAVASKKSFAAMPVIEARLTRLIAQIGSGRSDALVSAAAGPMLEEMAASLFVNMVNDAARLAARAGTAHGKALAEIRSELAVLLALPPDSIAASLPADIDIDISEAAQTFVLLELTAPRTSFGDVLSSGEKRVSFLTAQYLPQLKAALDTAIEEVLATLDARITPPFSTFMNEVEGFGQALSAIIRKRASDASTTAAALEESCGPEIDRLDGLAERFAELRKIVL